MPLYMDIHRNVDGTAHEVADAHNADLATQSKYNVRYLRWWFNDELRSVYCLVEAPSTEAAIKVHEDAHGLAADEIIPVEIGAVNDLIGPDEHGSAFREDPPGRISDDTVFRTIVFTDLEDSTPLSQRLGDDGYVELLGIHDDLLGSCLDAHGGLRVKHTGDGLMASFASVAKAVQCMIDMQRALAEHNTSRPDATLRARMGAAAGEPVSHHGDLFGAAVTLASRLSDHAEAGQIVVSSVVRDLSIGTGFSFADLGEATPRGFDEPVRLYEVHWRD